MGKILCATRGGDASKRSQEAAIKLAKETGDELIFFIAFDMDFMGQGNFALRPDVVSGEMTKMAEFLMAIAVERGEQEGIPARYIICEPCGNLEQGLIETIKEEGISLVILGRPAEGSSTFKLAELEALARSITTRTGVTVLIAPAA